MRLRPVPSEAGLFGLTAIVTDYVYDAARIDEVVR